MAIETRQAVKPLRPDERREMRPLHVVQIPRRFAKEEWGGTETVILETSKRLLTRGHHTEVLCPNALASTNQEIIGGVQVQRTPYFYPYWGLREATKRQLDKKGGNLFSFALWRTLKHLPQLDLIHLHTMGRLGGIARQVARKRRIPYLVSLHGGVYDVPAEESGAWHSLPPGAFDWGKVLGWWVGSRQVLRDAAAILCVGQQEQRLMQARHPDKRVEYLPNGVEPQRYLHGNGARFRETYGIPDKARVILTVGRIDPQKNQLLPVTALSRIRSARHGSLDPPTYLVLVGPVTNESYLADLRRTVDDSGLAGAVRIIPGLAPDDPTLADAYHAADVFVLPSIHEPFGIVVLEAWAAGLPVLASRVGGLPYFIEDGVDGILFDPRDPTGLIEAYNGLTPERSKALGEAGRRKAVTQYTWDAITERLVGIYQEVIRDHPAQQR